MLIFQIKCRALLSVNIKVQQIITMTQIFHKHTNGARQKVRQNSGNCPNGLTKLIFFWINTNSLHELKNELCKHKIGLNECKSPKVDYYEVCT